MGYRFTLETANTVANLTFGRVMSCYRDIYSSPECYMGFMHFLEQFDRNMYSNDSERYLRNVRRIRRILNEHECSDCFYSDDAQGDNAMRYHRDVLDALNELSSIFDRCRTKSLLLPSMMKQGGQCYDFMTSERTLGKLLEYHLGDSCLILQPQERPYNATIFNAFPNFEVALRQADMWPAVLFWQGSEKFVFIPVKHEDDLIHLYRIIKYERYPLDEIRRVAEARKKTSHYIFQLSDLHFGSKSVDVAERRLKNLVRSQLSNIEFGDNVSFVVTGDAVDSPNRATENDYSDFAEFIEAHCGKKPIRVLGNHDINNHGLALTRSSQQIANIVGEYPKIEIIEDAKTIMLLFNSNTNGNLAEGEIGTQQMSEMGNLLDNIDNLESYLLIAVLHHHLIPIQRPDYYERKWYERILPKSFLDMSLRLIDADLFLEWLRLRNVKLVLHGHKHIPFFDKHDGITVIGCGSSTGQINHKEKGKTFISYNMLKIGKQTVTCTQFAEEVFGAGAKNIRTEIINL